MVIRPTDSSGDILPVLSHADLYRGAKAVASVIDSRLKLLAGDWWENPSWGNAVVEMLQESRFTEADRQTLASYLSSYIRETPGVLDIRDMEYSMEGGQFRFTCTVETESGSTVIRLLF